MPRYQKHTRIATSLRLSLVAFTTLLLVTAWVPLLAPLTGGTARAAPLAQAAQPFQPLYVLPVERSSVVLETHTVRFALVGIEDGIAEVDVEALYRVRNPSDEPITLDLRVQTATGPIENQTSDLALSANGAGVALVPSENRRYAAQISVPSGQQSELRLRYRSPLPGDAPALRYTPRVVTEWPGTISFRADMVIPNGIDAASWLQVAPDDWSYGTTDPSATGPSATGTGAIDSIGIKWLYDGYLTDRTLLFRFVQPGLWAQIQAAVTAARPGDAGSPPAAAFADLGDLYARIYRSVEVEGTVRTRFYAQAMAAYIEGATAHSASPAPNNPAPNNDMARLYLGQAALYRDRVVGLMGGGAAQVAGLMADAAEQAMRFLPEGDARRSEMQQWLADALNLALNEARAAQQWSRAIALLDRLSALPQPMVDPAKIEQDRRLIMAQEALQLMERGNHAEMAPAAAALAGLNIDDPALKPPAQFRSLFAGWQVTVTALLDDVELEIVGLPAAGQEQPAYDGLRQVADLLEAGAPRRSGFRFVMEPPPSEGVVEQVRLRIGYPSSESALPLARLLPPSADWALLRTLLTQVAPSVERETLSMWQQVLLRQPMDLRGAGEQWATIAVGLERQAAEFDSASVPTSYNDPAAVESALLARVQAVNYRAAAQEWRGLARRSWLNFTFVVNEPTALIVGGQSPTRSWYATADTPSQVFLWQTQVLNVGRFAGFLAIALAVIGTIAGVLWSWL